VKLALTAAAPLTKGAVPKLVDPSRNVTVPVGFLCYRVRGNIGGDCYRCTDGGVRSGYLVTLTSRCNCAK